MAVLFELGSVISDRYLVNRFSMENTEGDQVYQAIDEILNRRVTLVIPTAGNQLIEQAKDFAKDSIQQNNEINILDINAFEGRKFLVTTEASGQKVLNFLNRSTQPQQTTVVSEPTPSPSSSESKINPNPPIPSALKVGKSSGKSSSKSVVAQRKSSKEASAELFDQFNDTQNPPVDSLKETKSTPHQSSSSSEDNSSAHSLDTEQNYAESWNDSTELSLTTPEPSTFWSRVPKNTDPDPVFDQNKADNDVMPPDIEISPLAAPVVDLVTSDIPVVPVNTTPMAPQVDEFLDVEPIPEPTVEKPRRKNRFSSRNHSQQPSQEKTTLAKPVQDTQEETPQEDLFDQEILNSHTGSKTSSSQEPSFDDIVSKNTLDDVEILPETTPRPRKKASKNSDPAQTSSKKSHKKASKSAQSQTTTKHSSDENFDKQVDGFLFDNAADVPQKRKNKNRTLWITAAILAILLVAFAIACYFMIANVSQKMPTFNDQVTEYSQQQDAKNKNNPSIENVTEFTQGLPAGGTDPEAENPSAPKNVISDDDQRWDSAEYQNENYGGLFTSLSLSLKLEKGAEVSSVTIDPYGLNGGKFTVYASDKADSTEDAQEIGNNIFSPSKKEVKIETEKKITSPYIIITFNTLPSYTNLDTGTLKYGLRINHIAVANQ